MKNTHIHTYMYNIYAYTYTYTHIETYSYIYIIPLQPYYMKKIEKKQDFNTVYNDNYTTIPLSPLEN